VVAPAQRTNRELDVYGSDGVLSIGSLAVKNSGKVSYSISAAGISKAQIAKDASFTGASVSQVAAPMSEPIRYQVLPET
jgi:hypothetical protein